jgi:GTP:adenosylcobinamide-phosphate guanylyltransferase
MGLVLAGRRGGADDPLRPVLGNAPHRALLDVGGTPMLVRVVRTLQASPQIGRVVVSIDEPEILGDVPELTTALADGSLRTHRSLSSPSRSVLDVLEGIAEGERVLVTTSDHPLLTTEMLDRFVSGAEASGGDVAVGLVLAETVRSRYPDAVRTYIPLRGGAYSGANLFAFRTPRARRAAAFWVKAEQFRKRPWRLVSVFGLGTLGLFALRQLDLDAALERVSRTIGAEIRAVSLPFPEAAVDVDRPSDHALVSRILAERP